MIWESILGAISLASFCITLGGIVFKLSRTLTTLESAIAALRETIGEFRSSSRETHERLFERIEDHESRITVLEKTNKKN